MLDKDIQQFLDGLDFIRSFKIVNDVGRLDVFAEKRMLGNLTLLHSRLF
jgi:hypothetical protein